VAPCDEASRLKSLSRHGGIPATHSEPSISSQDNPSLPLSHSWFVSPTFPLPGLSPTFPLLVCVSHFPTPGLCLPREKEGRRGGEGLEIRGARLQQALPFNCLPPLHRREL